MVNPYEKILKNRYRIEALIGRGGMAEVYQAWDTRRQHSVAIKLMREDLAEDLEFLERFKREARALAALSHANVVRFYSFERDGPLAFIVMDYVPGTTLRRRILEADGAPLPLEEVVSVTRQICAALHYAHQENVLHRDVKPGNIMIRPDGRVLVADFGIAKAADAATATTVMPGTPAYMSPEQCRSELLDARTDVYSLGIVVYEMLAGRRPFLGETAEIATGGTREKIRWEQIHADPPPLKQFNPALPAEAEAVVLKALAKEREERWPSVLAFWQAFQAVLAPEASEAGQGLAPAFTGRLPSEPRMEVLEEPSSPVPAVQPGEEMTRSRLAQLPPWAWLLGGLALVAVVIGVIALGSGGGMSATLTPIREVVSGENEMRTPTPTSSPPAPAAPDELATEVARAQAVAETLTASAPTNTTWPTGTPTSSPSAVPPGTATPTPTVRPSSTPARAPSWWTSSSFHLMVQATQARSETGLQVQEGQRVIIEYLNGNWRAGPSPTWPMVGPEGDQQVPSKSTFPVTNAPVMSLVAGIGGHSPLYVGDRIDFESPSTGLLWLGGNDDQFTDNDGYLLVSISILSSSSAAPASPPLSQIVFTCFIDGYDEVCTIGSDGNGERRLTYDAATDWYASFSPDGRQILFSSRRDDNFEIYTMEASGANQRRLTANLGSLYAPEISPDGRWLAFTSAREGSQNVWLMSPEGRDARALTSSNSNNVDPTWSPDSRQIAFSSDRTGDRAHYVMNADGSQLRMLDTGLEDLGGRSDWSPDGRWLAFYAGAADDRDIYLVAVDNSEVRRLTSGGNNVSPSYSPDGNWIVFASKRDGDLEIFIMQADGTGVTQLTYNNRPDWQPRWGP